MKFRIKKIDEEFVIVEDLYGVQKVCPVAIFPKEIKVDDFVKVIICKNEN